MFSISIVTAVYNECPEFLALIKHWLIYLERHNSIENFEIIICDDFSELSQYELLKDTFGNNQNITILRNLQNEGPGFSFNRAISMAKYDWTLIIDSDGQFPIQNLSELIKTIHSYDIDVVFAYRDVKYDNLFNKFGKNISNLLCNLIFNSNLKDFSCAFKLVKTSYLNKIKFDARYMNYSLDHTSKLLNMNLKFKEILVYCNSGKIKKRKLVNELIRAKYRFYYIFYLYIKLKLNKKRVIF
jgi:dolichol-phosphate mannosyltransferase